jgi:hypothetical protein
LIAISLTVVPSLKVIYWPEIVCVAVREAAMDGEIAIKRKSNVARRAALIPPLFLSVEKGES